MLVFVSKYFSILNLLPKFKNVATAKYNLLVGTAEEFNPVLGLGNLTTNLSR